LRHISEAGVVSDWSPPDSKPVERSSYNLRQVLVVLSGGDLIYFEVDTTGEVPILELGSLELGKDITCVDLGDVPEGQHRSPFAAVACWDNTLQIISVQPQDILNPRASSSFVAEPRSLCIVSPAGAAAGGAAHANYALYVGLSNGELIKMQMHSATGALTVTKQCVVATKAPTSISLARVAVAVPGTAQPVRAILVISSRTLLIYPQPQSSSSSSSSTPLGLAAAAKDCEIAVPLRPLDCVSTISTRAHRSGLAGISTGRFFFFDLTNFTQTFGETKHALTYTPRRMSRLPGTSSVAVVEADQSEALRRNTGASMDVDADEAAHVSSPPCKPFAPLPKSTPGRWVSCLRVLNLISGVSEAVVELTGNSAAFSVAALNFAEKATMVAKAGEGGGYASMTYIVAGTASGLSAPSSSSGTGYSLETYCFRGGRLIHHHSTDVEDVPLCMVEFQDKLLVGIGRSLRLYDMGRKRLLRKCELRGFPNHITKLAVSGGRVFVGDVTNSVTFVKYDRMDNTLKVFAEERRPR
jgi:splicing factor 3B subunit 3